MQGENLICRVNEKPRDNYYDPLLHFHSQAVVSGPFTPNLLGFKQMSADEISSLHHCLKRFQANSHVADRSRGTTAFCALISKPELISSSSFEYRFLIKLLLN